MDLVNVCEIEINLSIFYAQKEIGRSLVALRE